MTGVPYKGIYYTHLQRFYRTMAFLWVSWLSIVESDYLTSDLNHAGVVGSIIADNLSYTDIIALQTVVDQRNFLF